MAGSNASIGQYTGRDPDDHLGNVKEAIQLVDMTRGTVEAELRANLSERDYNFLCDMRQKLKIYGRGLVVTGRQLFYLRDVKDKLVAKGVI